MRRIVGIDPGLFGGLGVVELEGERVVNVALCRTPVLMVGRAHGRRREYDLRAMVDVLMRWHQPPALGVEVALELQNARPGQGVVSMFRLGVGFGVWLGIVAACGLPYELVAPTRWKRWHGLIGADKRAARLRLQDICPDLGPVHAVDEGAAEAALLAIYAARSIGSPSAGMETQQ